MPIGEALTKIEECVDRAFVWLHQEAGEGKSDPSALSMSLIAWREDTSQTLLEIFRSKAPAMSFMISEPEVRVTPLHAMLRNIMNRGCAALLRQRDDLLELRERLALAANALSEQFARHDELLALMRNSSTMTSELWHQVVVQPSLASPAARLMNAGLSQNAIWDLIKTTFAAIF
jgi:hypothetical protein